MAAVLDVTSRCINIMRNPMCRCLAAMRLVVAMPDVISDSLVKLLLCRMACLPGNCLHARYPRLEEWLAFRID